MKTYLLSFKTPNLNRQSGVALVIVLSMIVLLSALMVAFMSRVSTEGRAAKFALQGFEARQAAETAVNVVISQLREATKQGGWASQPGLIRTFESGKDGPVYKLYSSDKMMVTASAYNPSSPDEAGINAADLTTAPVGYANLNQPVFIPIPGQKDKFEAYFPICDPRSRLDENGDVALPGKGIIKGFHSADIAQASTSPKEDLNGNKIPVLPMNVRWLYQLRDGQLVASESEDGDDDSVNIPNATAINPPISRIAFWTDDEGSKILLNTASENTYWDTPHVSTVQEAGRIKTDGSLDYNPSDENAFLALAASQPAGGEYQRFPGHPATTSLSPAMRWLFPSPKSTQKGQKYTDAQFKEAIYRLAPRLNQGIGTTMGASRNVQLPLPIKDYRVFERDRLFSMVDDYFFRPDRSPLSQAGLYSVFQTTANPAEDAPSIDLANPNFTPEALQRMRFFLTASSRAPELNLFGLPRMSIWPINFEPAKQSGYDAVIAFCSSIGAPAKSGTTSKVAKFYFQRTNPWSATDDMAVDTNRNQVLYDYLMDLVGRPNPAAGGNYTAKYTVQGMKQIMTTMFDYIRCTNLIDTHGGNTALNIFPLAYTPHYGNYNSGGGKPNPGSGQVVPLRIGSTKGFGRFPTVSEVGLWIYYDDTLTLGAPAGYLLTDDETWAAGDEVTKIPIRCALAIEMFTPSPGYPALAEAYAYTVRELTPFTITTDSGSGAGTPKAMNIATSGTAANYVEVDPWRAWDGRFFMPTRGFSNHFMYDQGTARTAKRFSKTATAPNEDQIFPFVSKRFVMTGQNKALPTSFRITPGRLEIKIFALNRPALGAGSPISANTSATAIPVQTITVDFGSPTLTLPVPEKHSKTVNGNLDPNRTLQERMADNDVQVYAEDVVRSMEVNGATKGDYRMAASLPVVPVNFFARSGASAGTDYTDATKKQLHNFRSGWGRVIGGAQYGKLTANVVNRPDKVAKVPASVIGIQRQAGGLGDFDRGMSKHTDGAYINKPDEGNMLFNLNDQDPEGGGSIPYYRGGNGYEEVGESFFSPNRLIASAVMFGSLPTGAIQRRPWETLLFRPMSGDAATHKGATAPLDQYLLDFFHMPVVEPYPISEPLSTAGKININCMLAPFSYYPDPSSSGHGYIERYTAVQGLLTGMYQLAVPSSATDCGHSERPLKNNNKYRHKIDVHETIEKSFAPKMKEHGGYFRSAAEICEVDLLCPTAGFEKPSQRTSFWETPTTNNTDGMMTGDNQRERPYAHIYPRATTKSNIFTVHVWSQSLAKSPTSAVDKWNESKDSVTGEYRGATIIERFIDPNDEAFQKAEYADPAVAKNSLEPLYRYRIVNNKAFVVRQ